ncbi:MAG: S-layer homology domain-containing protein [bacterium]|nr:S-layer homology domain-containing protein [bacterium]MDE0288629.1 S-layer homology domain-containing protein [bacterium]MDE0439848.1 S-layer homology domain-containing protein [bacterium]
MTTRERAASPGRRRAAPLALVVVLLASILASPPAGGADGFTDVDPGGTHEAAINALADMGVFEDTECGEGEFCPGDPIERWVMAVWLIRVLGGDGSTTGTSRFADVDAAEWWSPFTEDLADREITAGCATGPLRYCPDDSVTRAQMASFLTRAFALEAAASAGFADTAGDTHEANIDALAAAEITAGCKTGPLRYCPGQAVTRAQMATFLHRAHLKQKDQMTEPDTATLSDDVPDVNMTDLSTGETVNLRSLFTGDKGVLFWFWAEW